MNGTSKQSVVNEQEGLSFLITLILEQILSLEGIQILFFENIYKDPNYGYCFRYYQSIGDTMNI
ncbi:unnamed protein product [Paramecium sonneborni]|uniref:Uncharacterized protein n=1 Tax=Paramecium sonneborni TaxID=65129 RepID=A0A8S1MCE4_9CILI|nr:unnamed protein product [Paramecium sonneborni]